MSEWVRNIGVKSGFYHRYESEQPRKATHCWRNTTGNLEESETGCGILCLPPRWCGC